MARRATTQEQGQNRAQAAREALRGPKTITEAPVAVSDARSAVYAAMTERQFQVEVVKALRRRGWTVWIVPNMRMTTAGLPDLLCIHEGWDLLLALELKRERGGKVSSPQQAAHAILRQIPGVHVKVLRPSEWPPFLAWIDSVDRESTR